MQFLFFNIRQLKTKLGDCNSMNDFMEIVGYIDEIMPKRLLSVEWISSCGEALSVAIIC